VLFVDMIGFTALADQLDPEDLRAVQTGYFAAITEVIHRWNGVVEKYIGDAVMAVFGVPDTDGYDAYRAVRAGTQLPKAVSRLRRPDGQPIHVRVGIATGEALVDLADASDGGQRLVCGDVVSVAARLQACAAVGTVMVTTSTQQATRTLMRYQRLGQAAIVGKPQPLEIWRPLGVAAARTGPDPADEVPLVGRIAELATLAESIARSLHAGIPQLISVVGPAGIGRSRLVRELSRRPDIGVGHGVRWQVCQCLPGGSHEDALGDIVRQGRVLATTRQPTVLVIEDLDRADAVVARFVRRLVEAAVVRRLPAVVVVTSRTALEELDGLKADCRVSLGALSSAENSRLLRHLIERAGQPPALVHRLLPLTNGNPMYAEAYVQMLAEQGTPTRPDVALPTPDPVRAAVSARLDQLSIADRRAVLAASVLGAAVPVDALAFLLRTTGDDADAILRRLECAGLLVQRPRSATGTQPEYTFPDPAVPAVAYARIPRSARAKYHARAGEWFDALPGAQVVSSRVMSDERPVPPPHDRNYQRPATMDRWCPITPFAARSPTSIGSRPNSSPR
jgi:class 3 adenylate cyclase